MMKIADPCKTVYEQTQTALALGTFDGVHIGHRAVLCAVQNAQGLLPAAFTFLQNPAAALGRNAPALTPFAQKCALLEKSGIQVLFGCDFLQVKDMDAATFVEEILLRRCAAKKIVCGYNFTFGKGGTGTPALLKALCEPQGVAVTVVEEQTVDGEPVCSTRIRELLAAGETEHANRLLGRWFSFTLPVVHGKQLGRTLGFPTINQMLLDSLICPKPGVYASAVNINGVWHGAVTDIGVKPTVGDGEPLSAETHIFGFAGDLYGQTVEVALLTYLRPEKKFDSVESLQKTVQEDLKTAKKIALQNKIAVI